VFALQKTYPPAIEQLVRPYDQSSPQRTVAALRRRSAHTRPWGDPLHRQRPGCDPHPVTAGMRERTHLPADPTAHRVRTPEATEKDGSKTPGRDRAVQDALKDRTAGDPMRQDVRWTEATPKRFPTVCTPTLSCWPPHRTTHAREAWLAGGRLPRGCPAATRRIARAVSPSGRAHARVARGGNRSCASIPKNKADVGTLYRDGKVSCREALKALLMMFPASPRVLIPHGLF